MSWSSATRQRNRELFKGLRVETTNCVCEVDVFTTKPRQVPPVSLLHLIRRTTKALLDFETDDVSENTTLAIS